MKRSAKILQNENKPPNNFFKSSLVIMDDLFISTKINLKQLWLKLKKSIKHLSKQAGLFSKCNDLDNRNKSVWWMAFLQGKRYMFNMVVLIYIFLHSSKYSINTINKPSHNVSLFSASGIFVAIWYQSVSALGILNGQGKNPSETWHPRY